MNVKFTPIDFDITRTKLAALPAGMQSMVYGAGLLEVAKKAAIKSKRLAPLGDNPPVTTKGKPRLRLRYSIKAQSIGWHWGGEKVPKSAAIVIAGQPHAILIESGFTHYRSGKRADTEPFLEPPMKDAGLMMDFERGASKAFVRLAKRFEKGRLTSRERRLSSIA